MPSVLSAEGNCEGGRYGKGTGQRNAPRASPCCRFPKGGDLCVSRVKLGETLVDALSDSDVQIDRATRV